MQSSAQVAGLGRLYRNFQAAGADVPAIFGGNTGPRSRGISKPAYPLPELIILQRDVPQAVWNGENLLVFQPKTLVVVDQRFVIRQVQWVTNPMTWQEGWKLLEATRALG